MNKHLAFILIEFTQIDVTESKVTVHWSQAPFYRPRQTTYDIQEVIETIMLETDEGKGVSPEFLLEEYRQCIIEMICDFHEKQTSEPWRMEIDYLQNVIKNLKNQVRRFTKIISALERRILKTNTVQIKKHHE